MQVQHTTKSLWNHKKLFLGSFDGIYIEFQHQNQERESLEHKYQIKSLQQPVQSGIKKKLENNTSATTNQSRNSLQGYV